MKNLSFIKLLSCSLLLSLTFGIKANAQETLKKILDPSLTTFLPTKDIQRLNRYRPIAPFDENIIYPTLEQIGNDPIRIKQEKILAMRPQERNLWSDIIVSPIFQLTPKLSLHGDGLMFLCRDYNKYEGLWIGYEMMLKYQIAKGESLIFRSSHNLTTKTWEYFQENRLIYYFAPRLDGMFLLAGGHSSRATTPITRYEEYTSRFINPIALNNSRRDYVYNYLSLRHTLSPFRDFDYSAYALVQDRRAKYSQDPASAKLFSWGLDMMYDFTRYRSENDRYPMARQIPYGNKSIALGAKIQQTYFLNNAERMVYSNLPKSFTEVELYGRSSWADKYFTHHLDVFGGVMLDPSPYAIDQKQFRHNSMMSLQPFDNAWATMPTNFAVGNRWLGGYYNAYSQNLLLSRTFLGPSGIGFDEGLHFKAVSDLGANWDQYVEVGYSIGWDKMFRVGFFLGADLEHFVPNWAVALNIPIGHLLSKWGERY